MVEQAAELEGQADASDAWEHPKPPASEIHGEMRASAPFDLSAGHSTWLGPQAWKLNRGSAVGLIEVCAGRGMLSDAFEECRDGLEAFHLGHLHGQELRSQEGHWFTLSLIGLCKPEDVFVSFPCKDWSR